MSKKILSSLLIIVIAAYFGIQRYTDYIENPWTRDGQIRAHIIEVTPRVTGPVTQLNVEDNHFVKAGDVLFEIDQSVFIASLDQARANLLQAKALLERAKNEEHRSAALEKMKPGSVPVLTLNNLENDIQTASANVKAAAAATKVAELNLEFTTVVAPKDGFITNLNLQQGSQVVANQPVVALIENDSFWVEGFFEETDLRDIGLGSKAQVTLMSHPDTPLHGYVESMGFGISKQDGSTGSFLLPTVNPNFQWIRLAQRVPVKVKLTETPDDFNLIVGTTASVLVHKSQ
ncbi:efflux transporter periplasmic adaptor subunit [Vibrio sp. 10N.286.49.C2]|uniref:efflux RND transporter periplasmic adaptor subunit n=1 Tax=unclassified Vibrio TaxID=2614977 RepID=UPI000C849B04|nr:MULTISPECIES: HlyD family secretion protein [unclassified Vibrio]PMH38198.1 efflux transporter periplasmic adaptor subunit [Vibrio sp. 10N.286.49.C2]PMH53596.1 efflux transporter periplasmic adaptor subunit [Vibrio sp. 10N.286.49.B1]